MATLPTNSTINISRPAYYTDTNISAPTYTTPLTVASPSYLSGKSDGTTVSLADVPPLEQNLKYSPGYFYRDNDQYTIQDIASKDILKALANNYAVTEKSVYYVSKTLLDISNALDDFSRIVAYHRILGDTSTTEDSPYVKLDKIYLDLATASEAAEKSPEKVLADYYSTFDSASRRVEYSRVFINYATATDDVLGEANIDDDQYAFFNKVLKSSYYVIEQVLTQTEFNRGFTEERLISQSVNFLDLKKLQPDTVDTSTVLSFDSNKQLKHIANTYQIFSKNISSVLLDQLYTSDSNYINILPLYINYVSTTDQYYSIVAFNRVFIDTVTPTDDVLGEANIDDDQYALLNKGVRDTSVANSIISNKTEFIRSYTELSTTNDTAVLNVSRNQIDKTYVGDILKLLRVDKVLASSAGTLETAVFELTKQLLSIYTTSSINTLQFTKDLLSATNTLDNVATRINYIRIYTDTVAATDDVLGQANVDDDQTAVINKVLKHQYSSIDTISTKTEFERLAYSTYTTNSNSDYVFNKLLLDQSNTVSVNNFYFAKSNLDNYTTSDYIAISQSKLELDSTTAGDYALISTTKAVTNTAYTGEEHFILVLFNRSFTDTVSVTDDVLGNANIDDDQTAAFIKVLKDTASSADSVSSTAEFIRISLDTVTPNSAYSASYAKVLENSLATTVDAAPIFNNGILKIDFTYTQQDFSSKAEYIRNYLDLSIASSSNKLHITKQVNEIVNAIDLGIEQLLYTSKNLSSSYSINDINSKSQQKSLLDIASTVEKAVYSISLNKLDVINTAELVLKQVTFYRNWSDPITTADPNALTVQKPVPSDSIQHADLSIVNIMPGIIDYVLTSETITGHNQNYFEPGYVHPGYVGTDYIL